MNRREFLHNCLLSSLGVATLGVSATGRPVVDASHGFVKPPVPVGDIGMRGADGRTHTLRELLLGATSAIHLVFAGCTTTCPIQAAIFQRLQRLLREREAHGIQLVSLSIDPQNDGPKELRNWLRRYHAGPAWLAAVPNQADLADMRALFGQGDDLIESHTTQVSIVNRNAEVIWRSKDLPPAEELADLLQHA